MAEIIGVMCRDCERHVAGHAILPTFTGHEAVGEMTVDALRLGYAIFLSHEATISISDHGPKCPTGAKIKQAEGDGLCVCLDCGAKQQLLTPAWEGACPSCGLWHVYRPAPSPEPAEPEERVRCNNCGLVIPKSAADGYCGVERHGSNYTRTEHEVPTTYTPVEA